MVELFLDIDGVVLDFEGSFVDFVREHYLPELPEDYILQTWEVSEEFKELNIEKVWHHFVNSEKFSKMGLLLDSNSFNQLSEKFPLYLVTNIPNAQYESRVKNLKLHRLNYTGLYLAGHFNFGEQNYPKKSDVIKDLHHPETDLIFLDDHPKNCLDIKTHFPESHVYLMERPHNKKAEDLSWKRVKGWHEFYESVSKEYL